MGATTPIIHTKKIPNDQKKKMMDIAEEQVTVHNMAKLGIKVGAKNLHSVQNIKGKTLEKFNKPAK